ncbi:MAG: ribosome maturation factor RimM [Bacilli bacterium]|nr:ribosome maturation factor RimM [Bacilli bacterium]
MKYIYVGKIVGTHALKGEVRILSDFEYKKDTFKIGMPLYIGKEHKKVVINSYRVHKNYDMVTFIGFEKIEDVLPYKGQRVYINRDDMKTDSIFFEDLIGLSVYDEEGLLGTVTAIEKTKAHPILVIDHKHRIPYIPPFINAVEVDKKRILIHNMEGLIYEN